MTPDPKPDPAVPPTTRPEIYWLKSTILSYGEYDSQGILRPRESSVVCTYEKPDVPRGERTWHILTVRVHQDSDEDAIYVTVPNGTKSTKVELFNSAYANVPGDRIFKGVSYNTVFLG